MRISSPVETQPMVDVDDADLSLASLYTAGDPHLVWRTMRVRHPVFWNRRPVGPGFWAVTRHADVRWVLRDHDAFTSQRGTAVDMLGMPDPAAGKMMHATDPPCHRRIRTPLERPLVAQAMPQYASLISALVREAVAPVPSPATWDAAAVMTRLPLSVMVRLMDLPATDLEQLLHAAYASVAPQDPRYRTGSANQTLGWAHSAIVDYFTAAVRERRTSPAGDLLSHLITMDIGGRTLTEEEVVVNCFSLLVGGVVTTAQAASAALIALAEQGGGRAHWPSQLPVSGLVEEALRWSSPTTHFMRHARRDQVLHGVRIAAGDPVTAWIGAANRDEAVFDRPYVFDPTRRPNRHISFGSGPHRCVGRQLARLMLQEILGRLGATIDSFTLAGPPVHLESNLIAGLVSLPLTVSVHAGAWRTGAGTSYPR